MNSMVFLLLHVELCSIPFIHSFSLFVSYVFCGFFFSRTCCRTTINMVILHFTMSFKTEWKQQNIDNRKLVQVQWCKLCTWISALLRLLVDFYYFWKSFIFATSGAYKHFELVRSQKAVEKTVILYFNIYLNISVWNNKQRNSLFLPHFSKYIWTIYFYTF